ncbi:MAG: hypothetical protein NWE78_05590, partial [Candidatus Bathyarchaeota archaeon]|nr:hypothetical protein [Candidatus Bathyarchaeota archaeon]
MGSIIVSVNAIKTYVIPTTIDVSHISQSTHLTEHRNTLVTIEDSPKKDNSLWNVLYLGEEVRKTSAVLFSVLLAYLMTLSSDIRPAKARTITIPDGYLTIQEAINHATDGDIVFASA